MNLKLNFAIIGILLASTAIGGLCLFTIPQRQPQPVAIVQNVAPLEEAKKRVATKDSAEALSHLTTLSDLFSASKRKATFVQPTEFEIENFEANLLATLNPKASFDELESAWASEKWTLCHAIQNDETFVVIHEPKNDRRGRGFYAFRIGSNSSVALQAPHRFFDSGTGTIAERIFLEHDCLAAAWNTVPRKQYDLAHQRDHYINAYTRALLKHDAKIVFFQLHGFANEKQKGAGRTAKIIVSDSTKFPGRLVRNLSSDLKENFGNEFVRLFPIEVRQLGGTTNEQARVVHNAGSLGFLHLELNKDFRESLKESADDRSAFYKSLAGAASNSGESDRP